MDIDFDITILCFKFGSTVLDNKGLSSGVPRNPEIIWVWGFLTIFWQDAIGLDFYLKEWQKAFKICKRSYSVKYDFLF